MSAQGVTTVKNVLLQVKVRPEDKQMIENVAELYDLDVRRFVVLAAQYIEHVKPTLEISPAGKDSAPTPVLQTA